MRRFDDPICSPMTGESADELWARSVELAGTVGAGYVEKRGIPVSVAEVAGVRYLDDFEGRPAVVARMRGGDGRLNAVHGRYLHYRHNENKMITVGRAGGAVSLLNGPNTKALVIVEGLFDALSLAVCGFSSIATIGRWAPWLTEASAGRNVWLAFDAGRPGDADVLLYQQRLPDASIRRLLPPPRCKDWNTALQKLGRGTVTQWVVKTMAEPGKIMP